MLNMHKSRNSYRDRYNNIYNRSDKDVLDHKQLVFY